MLLWAACTAAHAVAAVTHKCRKVPADLFYQPWLGAQRLLFQPPHSLSHGHQAVQRGHRCQQLVNLLHSMLPVWCCLCIKASHIVCDFICIATSHTCCCGCCACWRGGLALGRALRPATAVARPRLGSCCSLPVTAVVPRAALVLLLQLLLALSTAAAAALRALPADLPLRPMLDVCCFACLLTNSLLLAGATSAAVRSSIICRTLLWGAVVLLLLLLLLAGHARLAWLAAGSCIRAPALGCLLTVSS